MSCYEIARKQIGLKMQMKKKEMPSQIMKRNVRGTKDTASPFTYLRLNYQSRRLPNLDKLAFLLISGVWDSGLTGLEAER